MYTSLKEFIEDWQHESTLTGKILAALTDESLTQPVSNDDRTLGRIAWHIATTIPEMMGRTGLTFAKDYDETSVPSSAKVIHGTYEAFARELVRLLETQWTDASLTVEDAMYGEAWPRALTLSVLIRHEIHHRAQMTVLMRQAGLLVPGIYGPAREDWAQMGMTPPAI